MPNETISNQIETAHNHKQSVEKLHEKAREYKKSIGFEPELLGIVDAGATVKGRNPFQHDSPTSYGDILESATPTETSAYARYKVRLTPQQFPTIGAPGGKARAIAAAELLKHFPDADIVTTSHYPLINQNMGDNAPPDRLPAENHADVYKNYEEKVLGVDENKIFTEDASTDTFEGIIDILHLALEKGLKNVVIITNKYHKRVQAFCDAIFEKSDDNSSQNIDKLKFILGLLDLHAQDVHNTENQKKSRYKDIMGYTVTYSDTGDPQLHWDKNNDFLNKIKQLKFRVVYAEDILPSRDPHYANLMKKVTPLVAKLEPGEQNGVRQIQDGTYNEQAFRKEYERIHPKPE